MRSQRPGHCRLAVENPRSGSGSMGVLIAPSVPPPHRVSSTCNRQTLVTAGRQSTPARRTGGPCCRPSPWAGGCCRPRARRARMILSRLIAPGSYCASPRGPPRRQPKRAGQVVVAERGAAHEAPCRRRTSGSGSTADQRARRRPGSRVRVVSNIASPLFLEDECPGAATRCDAWRGRVDPLPRRPRAGAIARMGGHVALIGVLSGVDRRRRPALGRQPRLQALIVGSRPSSRRWCARWRRAARRRTLAHACLAADPGHGNSLPSGW